MERLPLRRMLAASPAPPGRVCFYSLWFAGHNNPRYAELLPRLDRLDRYLLTLPERQPLRALAYRPWRRWHDRLDGRVLRAASRRYRHLFSTDVEQIPLFGGPILLDVDDPTFSPREVELLAAPNVAAYVVTAERAGRRFEELGVERPWHVVPQGASLGSLSPAAVADVAARHRRDGEVVVGYMAAWLLSEGDRGGANPLYNVDHLLELWDEIHARAPQARLWLLGGASERVRRRVAGRDDVVLFGRVTRDLVLAYAANFDVALYPRTEDQGIRAAKVAEYLGVGVPTVSYDFAVVEDLRETGAGVLVRTGREFAEAVARLATDGAERRRLAEAARAAGAERDWDRLAGRYRALLDEYLPPR